MTDHDFETVQAGVKAYRRALDSKNGHALYAQTIYVERNAPTWLTGLLQECKAFRRIGPTAETAIALDVLSGEIPPMKAVYVCAPLHGNIKKNIANARHYCETILRLGYIPIAPHVMLDGITNDNDPIQRNIALNMGLEILRFCSELWVFGEIVTKGMKGEIDRANELKIPVRRM